MTDFPNFDAFLEAKERGLAGGDPDYTGPLALKPDQTPTAGKTSVPLPYKSTPEEDAGNWQVGTDDDVAVSEKGSPGMTPDNSVPGGKKPETKIELKKKPSQLKMEEFSDATRNLPTHQFVKLLAEERMGLTIPTVTDLYGNEYTPDPTQTIQYVAALVGANESLMGRFVREVKRQGSLSKLFENALELPDSYEHLVEGMRQADNGPKRCKNLAKAMNDTYVKALDAFEIDESVAPPRGMNDLGSPPQGGAFGGGGMDNTPAPTQGGPMGGGGIDNSPMPTQGGAFGGGGPQPPAAGGATGGMPNFGDGPLPAPGPRGRLKEATAHGNLIEAMSEYPVLLDHMKSKFTM